MAAVQIAAPGTEAGPCVDGGCGHAYCDDWRGMAAQCCHYCGEPIGFARRFYTSDGGWSDLVHATCHEAAVSS